MNEDDDSADSNCDIDGSIEGGWPNNEGGSNYLVRDDDDMFEDADGEMERLRRSLRTFSQNLRKDAKAIVIKDQCMSPSPKYN